LNDTQYHYPIDGIVFKWNHIKEYEAAGRTEHHFRGGFAYKFYDEEYETELLDLEYTMGKTGVLSPVAIYKTIEIDGAECSRASLHNLNTLTTLLGEYPYVGQKIKIFKANQIIPQVSSAIKAEEILGADPGYYLNDTETKFLFPPKECPICGAPTEIRESDSGTIELYCSSDTCEGKLINRLEHFVSKKGLDIKGLSKATLEKLIDWGWVTRAKDLFYLYQRRREWVEKPGFGIKSVDKVLDAIETARHTTLEKYLSAISIPLIGKTYARQLANSFIDYWELRGAINRREDFSEYDGFGPAMHDAIINFDYTEADTMVERCIIDFTEEESALENSGNALQGKTFVVTGKVHIWKNRDELSAAVTAAGGKVTSSVSSKTDYLVNNDINSTSSKNLKAKELGIPIITEEQLQELMK
jgi:DNA ligase (NAD+)